MFPSDAASALNRSGKYATVDFNAQKNRQATGVFLPP
jgi:hypothetical protein